MRVILVVCRAPGGCARAAGIRVIGVCEASHHWSSRAIGFQVFGRRGGFGGLDEPYEAVGIEVRRLGMGSWSRGGSEAKCAGECVGPSEARGGGNVVLSG